MLRQAQSLSFHTASHICVGRRCSWLLGHPSFFPGANEDGAATFLMGAMAATIERAGKTNTYTAAPTFTTFP